MEYLIAVTIPGEFGEELAYLQHQFKAPTWRVSIPPHITIIPPGRALVSPEQAKVLFEAITLPAGSFEVPCRNIHKFERTVWLEPHAAELSMLRDAIIPGAKQFMSLDEAESRPFIPHITLSNKIQDFDLSRVYEELLALDPKGIFKCSNVGLFQKTKDEKTWQLIAQKTI